MAFGPPVIESESSVEVGGTVGGAAGRSVDPQNVDTRVLVEYGTSSGYGEKTAEVDIGAGAGGQRVPVALPGLSAGSGISLPVCRGKRAWGRCGCGCGWGPGVSGRRVRVCSGCRMSGRRNWCLRVIVMARVSNRWGVVMMGVGRSRLRRVVAAVSYVTNIPVGG